MIVSDIEQLWEERSRRYGTKSKGVLPKSLPAPVNESLHQWMYQQVKSKIKNQKSRILDVGCGYGRLSAPLLTEFPDVRTAGIDVSRYYVELYNKNLAPRGVAVKGDVRKLPFAKNTFDLVFVVTTLMYVVKESEQEKAIRECLRVLKDDGYLVIIERNPAGQWLVTLGGLITKLRGRKNKEIPAASFSPDQMLVLIEKSWGKVEAINGMPFWTLLLPFSAFVSYFNSALARWFLRIISQIDKRYSRLLTPSLYIAYTCSK